MKSPLMLEVLNEKRLPEQLFTNFIERSLGEHPWPWVVEPRGSAFAVVAKDGADIANYDSKASADQVICLAETMVDADLEPLLHFRAGKHKTNPMVHQP